jgi:ABC-type lipoprotein release transport system permease subunit
MLFSTRVALRYLRATPMQSALLLAGVGVAVLAFVFITALINGLAVTLTARTIGNIGHVTLEPAERVPKVSLPVPEGGWSLVARQKSPFEVEQIRDGNRLLRRLDALPGVVGVSPEVIGAGFLPCARPANRQPPAGGFVVVAWRAVAGASPTLWMRAVAGAD